MSNTQHKDTIASEVLSASLGGAISASILYPLEVLKTKMQTEDNSNNDNDDDKDKKGGGGGMIDYAITLYEKEGFQVYLNGIETSAFQSAMEKAFYFFAYTGLKNTYQTIRFLINPSTASSSSGTSMNATTNLILGCLAEWCHLPITMPIDCLSTAIQTSSSKSSTTINTQQQTAFAILMNILKEGNMYKGIQAYYVLCFKPALQYTVYEQVKAKVLAHRTTKTLSASEAFLLGMIARTIATVAVFPFVRAKVVLQSQQKNNKKKQLSSSTTENGGCNNVEDNDDECSPSVWSLLSSIYEKDGIPGLYQGIGPELTRGVFSAALMLMIKEKINGSVKNVLYGDNNNSSSHHHHRHNLRR